MPSNNNSNNTFNIVSSTTESYHYQDFSPTPVSSPLTVRTQSSPPRSPHYQPITGLSPTTFTAPTSLSSTPTGLMASDDDASLYSPHTPTDSNRQNTFYHHYNQCK
ncbi:hypothetical protein BC941DRAFT_45156 [Chlamydoabsidia padenii]|nr:hypothetical protein BC941DRAFT_45156 [Chlamydoabsidia padenii]